MNNFWVPCTHEVYWDALVSAGYTTGPCGPVVVYASCSKNFSNPSSLYMLTEWGIREVNQPVARMLREGEGNAETTNNWIAKPGAECITCKEYVPGLDKDDVCQDCKTETIIPQDSHSLQ